MSKHLGGLCVEQLEPVAVDENTRISSWRIRREPSGDVDADNELYVPDDHTQPLFSAASRAEPEQVGF